MARFSHWEYVDRQTFWGWRREWYPIYVDDRAVVNMVFNIKVVQRDSELVQIEQETARMYALKQKLDAEAAMLDSYIKVARRQAELQGVLQLTQQKQTAGQPKLIPYQPQIPMTKVR
jgi:hypothetical protein